MAEDVHAIVSSYLLLHGFDGLVNDNGECGCQLSDLMPCGSWTGDCVAAKKVACVPSDCPLDGECEWHMQAPVNEGNQ